MHNKKVIRFQEALDIIESFPEKQQETLVSIIQKRLLEHKRDIIAKNIQKAREEYIRGEVKKGTVDDLLKEL